MPVDKGGFKSRWIVTKYANKKAYLAGKHYQRNVIKENIMLDAGITIAMQRICGVTATAFDNTNARLGVGDAGLTALTGTLTLTNGSKAFSGSGTAFDTQLAEGDKIQLNADALLKRVAGITSATAGTLEELYDGTAASGGPGSFISPLETGLQAASNKAYVGMEATYPQVSAQTATWRAVFDGDTANYAWNEFTVDNGTTSLNRKVDNQGTKGVGQIWTLELKITHR